eukprot:scaffold9153_cov121-Cylindrotheca_fusiformis.AAC.5
MASSPNTTTTLILLCLFIGARVDSFHTVAKWTHGSALSAMLPSTSAGESSAIGRTILDQMSENHQASLEYAEMFGLGATETGLYCLFHSMRKSGIALGLKGLPFVLRNDDISQALDLKQSCFSDFFTMLDLEQALEDDFLDASRGSTDNRKGWKIAAVSSPRGDSFEQARMRFEDVQAAMEKGTVIFNAAGAHIPKLAGPCLAITDATSTPNALNLYITAPGKRTSAPPHTDKQDVVVVQTSGRKSWRVYMPTDSAQKPMSDVFARGKGDDNLPLYTLEENGTLLIETILERGDVLFVPAGFPHTTGTVVDASADDDASLHMTFNIDTHVWDLDYHSARRLALRRACVHDTALGQSKEEDNRYIGKVNELSAELHQDIFSELPLGFLDEEPTEGEASIETVTSQLMEIAREVDPETFSQVEQSIWKETIEKLRQYGMELVDIHRDMYLAAIEEGRTREAEQAITAHLDESKEKKPMTPQRMQRKAGLVEWSYAGKPSAMSTPGGTGLPENWAFTLDIKVGDQVEADLGGAFFPATVTRVVGNLYDVKFFDGDQETGLERSMLKLMTPPSLTTEEMDTSEMTPKQLKRWKKQQEKKNKKKTSIK